MLVEMLPPGEISAGPAGPCRVFAHGLLRQPPPGSCSEQLAHQRHKPPQGAVRNCDVLGAGSCAEAGGHQQMEESEEQKQDVLLNWSTGAGKSLCYQLPAVLAWHRHRGVTVVVEPLISLMRDQVVNFNALSNSSDAPRATFLGSGQSDASMDQRVLVGEFCLVYVTPEKLTEGLLLGLEQLYRSGRLELVVMDEAACISLWGHDFRPSFRNMWWVREQYPQVPFMALSASMTEDIRRDISDQLCLRDPFVSTLPYFRPNLDIACTHKEGFKKDMARIAEAIKPGELTIVYVPQPSTAVKVAAKLESLLQDRGIQVGVYTGATEKGERERVQTAFDRDELQVLVATVAFGMGIDKPDVRNIIHYGLPKCMEDFHQQIGRAGRDGLPSRCDTLFGNSDWKLWFSRYFTQEYKHWDKEDLKRHLESTEHLHQLVAGHGCRQQAILAYFGRTVELEVLKSSRLCRCDVCLGRCGAWLGTSERRDFFREARLVLEAVRVAQELPKGKGKGASKETVLRLMNWQSKSRLGDVTSRIPKALVNNLKVFRDELPGARRTQSYASEMFDMLYGDGYLTRQISSAENLRCFVWRLTDFGESVLIWGQPVPLLPTSKLRKLEMEPHERNELAQTQAEYKKLKKEAFKVMPCYLRELTNPTSTEAPSDEYAMWERLMSMSDSMKGLAAVANMTDRADEDSQATVITAGAQIQVAAETNALTEPCAESGLAASSSSFVSVTNLCSDLNGPPAYNFLDILYAVLGHHLQRTPESQDVVLEYITDAENLNRCVLHLPSLQGLKFSSSRAHAKQCAARKSAILAALQALIAMPLSNFRTGMHITAATRMQSRTDLLEIPLLLWCMAKHMQRHPRREDVSFAYFLDSGQGYRCVVTLRTFGGIQFSTNRAFKMKSDAKLCAILHACRALLSLLRTTVKHISRLLACLAKHTQHVLRQEDVEFRYSVDSRQAYRCIISVPALGGLQFSNPSLQKTKSNAKALAIRHACTALDARSSPGSSANTKKMSRLLACLAKHMQCPPQEEDVKFTYVLDSNRFYRCVITVPALGGVQFSNPTPQTYRSTATVLSINRACTLLAAAPNIEALHLSNSHPVPAKARTILMSGLLECLEKHMQRTPVEEDVEFSYVIDSSRAYRCVISVPALGGLQFSNEKPQRQKCEAKKYAIRSACRGIKKMPSPGKEVQVA
ncbi:unnamed protein product [Polarella glacialis]|uniref:DNA 3'-5' helicase n=1 Tax=Polarella glacialis TaxID=89957 RepID=A0A813D8D5_POLGL|nr:unnamed protein product [Polarella glacialis]